MGGVARDPTEMETRVAQAIFDELMGWEEWSVRDLAEEIAPKVIRAMRDPSDEVMEGFRCAGKDEWNRALDIASPLSYTQATAGTVTGDCTCR